MFYDVFVFLLLMSWMVYSYIDSPMHTPADKTGSGGSDVRYFERQTVSKFKVKLGLNADLSEIINWGHGF